MRFCSIFSQLLQIFPRQDFRKAVEETKAERHARGFGCWDQFVAMLFCQLAQALSVSAGAVTARGVSGFGQLQRQVMSPGPQASTGAFDFSRVQL